MGVHAAPADAVAAGQGQHRLAEPAQHRSRQQHRAANLLKELNPRRGEPGSARTQVQRGAIPAHTHAEFGQNLKHGAHVADLRHVVQPDLSFGQEDGGQNRQRRVLVAGRSDIAGQGMIALNNEFLH